MRDNLPVEEMRRRIEKMGNEHVIAFTKSELQALIASGGMADDAYTNAAMRTCNVDREAIIKRFSDPMVLDLHHAAMGMVTEIGEFMDILKRHLIYGKPLDLVHIMEEHGDTSWYSALWARAAGFTLTESKEKNIAKLRARYPEKFTNEAALNRDLDQETQSAGGGVMTDSGREWEERLPGHNKVTDVCGSCQMLLGDPALDLCVYKKYHWHEFVPTQERGNDGCRLCRLGPGAFIHNTVSAQSMLKRELEGEKKKLPPPQNTCMMCKRHWIQRSPECPSATTHESVAQAYEDSPNQVVVQNVERVNHPAHYGGGDNPYEVIKVINAWGLNFSLGNAVKYIARAGKKEGTPDIEDLEKASWYLRNEIKERERRAQ